MKAVTGSATENESVKNDGKELPSLTSAVLSDIDRIEGSKKIYDLSLAEDLIDLLKKEDNSRVKKEVSRHIEKLISACDEARDHKVVLLYDPNNSITRWHAERIYKAIQEPVDGKDLILILRSPGGNVEPAFLISKICIRCKNGKFKVVVPAEAKSAATLLSLGADEIHMGGMSELGPIDPQIDGLPVLSIPHALEKIAYLANKYPKSSSMFAEYLSKALNLKIIGYYDRVTESAAQYAQLLLRRKKDSSGKPIADIAAKFTTHYKDHRFVIDVDDAKDILGEDVVKENSSLYFLGANIVSFLNSLELAVFLHKNGMKISYVGNECEFYLEEN
ncbi:SDH family Clp fold serine proteinase [Buttiauxella gaviniae]|uniref:SDH family Clp fold serine proteinase n=1 Tax=Buttiauxella gaviniae TaxID=82990 RepID=UPI003C779F3B